MSENRVERAIIMAAGMGKRLQPLTLNTPKPLIRVHGRPMIETIIDALLLNDIKEIYIVVGYLKEQFCYLAEKYGAILIENPHYTSCNNISSLYAAREYLQNAIILDGDQLVNNTSALAPAFSRSGYNCVWTENHTSEWLLKIENDVVTSCSKTGGEKGWQLYSISRWSAEDGKKLKHHLEIEFCERENRDIYWDDVALFCYPEEYSLGIREMSLGDVVEIDNLEELKMIDHTYIGIKAEGVAR